MADEDDRRKHVPERTSDAEKAVAKGRTSQEGVSELGRPKDSDRADRADDPANEPADDKRDERRP